MSSLHQPGTLRIERAVDGKCLLEVEQIVILLHFFFHSKPDLIDINHEAFHEKLLLCREACLNLSEMPYKNETTTLKTEWKL